MSFTAAWYFGLSIASLAAALGSGTLMCVVPFRQAYPLYMASLLFILGSIGFIGAAMWLSSWPHP